MPSSGDGLTPNQLDIYEEFSATIEDSPSRHQRDIIDPVNQGFLKMVEAIRNRGETLQENDLSRNAQAEEEIKKIQTHISKVKKERGSTQIPQQLALIEREIEAWWNDSLFKQIFFDSEEAELLGLAELMNCLAALELGKVVRRAMASWILKMQKRCFQILQGYSTNSEQARAKVVGTLIEVTMLMMRKRLVGVE